MISTGEYRSKDESYSIAIEHCSNPGKVLIVLWLGNDIKSVYLKNTSGEYSAVSNKARELYNSLIANGLKRCTSKNGSLQPFVLGASMLHTFTSGKTNIKSGNIELYNKEMVSCQIEEIKYGKDNNEESYKTVVTQFNNRQDMLEFVRSVEANSKLVKHASNVTDINSVSGNNVVIRSVEEIALEKEDLTWLENKKYYIINDEAQAEQIFSYLDNYKGLIAYDVETTGLRINMFGKVGSERAKQLEEYNANNPEKQLRVDELVGIIFCVEPNVSYYFPVKNKKFKNLYESGEYRNKYINNIKTRYTIGDRCCDNGDEARYIRETSYEDFRNDVILMERVRDILEKGNIDTHGGGYEQKVAFYYDILVNIVDDSMILHQIMYKFRSTTSNKGEASNLKYLSKIDLGIDQWELKDFFPQYKELQGETQKVSPIDFSLMDYEGTKIYAPTDGDCTLQLTMKYKKDMLENHRDQQYIYSVELIVMRAIAYMEFYGCRIDTEKIEEKRRETIKKITILESKFRQDINFSSTEEIRVREEIEYIDEKLASLSNNEEQDSLLDRSYNLVEELKEIIKNEDKKVNINSPSQVAEVFFDMLEYPTSGDSRSVDRKKIKSLCSYKNEDGTDKYPVAAIYKEYKAQMTLLTKFFGKLQDFMYLDGFIFASFGGISTATGRMSCKAPNLQQMPKAITKIIIPRDDCVFCDADYSQIEYRILSGMANEPYLLSEFKNPDTDYHTLQASMMYGEKYENVTKQMRSDAKSFNFGIPYGMGDGSLAILLVGVNNAVTREMAREKKELYFKNQPNVKQFFADVKEFAQIYGYTKTLWNRVRAYNFMRKDGSVNEAAKASALRQAGNAIIQGCLSGETRIQTKALGIVKIADVVNTEQYVWDGTDWTSGDIVYSGKKQKCIVHFSNGQEFICSPNHKFLYAGKDETDISNYAECKNLKRYDLIEYNMKSDLKIKDYDIVSSMDTIEADYDSEYNTNIYEEIEGCHGLQVESVEITDEYIDMYDVCNTERGYYVADGIVTHNSAADVFKIGVARNFMWIVQNGLIGKVFISNMIHDEQLVEINYKELNVKKVVANVVNNMGFSVDGLPPLYVGAGVSSTWYLAKDSFSEIHPNLIHEYQTSTLNEPLFGYGNFETLYECVKHFNWLNHDFRRNKIRDYLLNTDNIGSKLHPVIGTLIKDCFNNGNEDATIEELLGEFIKNEGLEGITKEMFTAEYLEKDVEDDVEYEDDEDEEGDIFDEHEFTVIDESNDIYGMSIEDWIEEFTLVASVSRHILGIDTRKISYRKLDRLLDYLSDRVCDSDDKDAMRITFLKGGRILEKTDVYVKDLDSIELHRKFGGVL